MLHPDPLELACWVIDLRNRKSVAEAERESWELKLELGPKCFTNEGYGFSCSIKWAYGVPAHMIHAPVLVGLSLRPVALGSNGHTISQLGAHFCAVPEVAHLGENSPGSNRNGRAILRGRI
jgi:hypothetical protein